MKVMINKLLLIKLEAMSMDIKTYINYNAILLLDFNEDERQNIPQLDDDDVEKLLNIRKEIKNILKKYKT